MAENSLSIVEKFDVADCKNRWHLFIRTDLRFKVDRDPRAVALICISYRREFTQYFNKIRRNIIMKRRNVDLSKVRRPPIKQQRGRVSDGLYQRFNRFFGVAED